MPTIASIEVFSFALPFSGTFRTSRGAVGSAQSGRSVVLVKLTASDNTIGWGEGSPVPNWSPETRESVLSTLGRYFAPALLGKSIEDIDGLHHIMDQTIAPLYGLSMPIARAAIDIAAHDCLARHLKIPIRDLPGYRRTDEIRLSWTVTGGTVTEVETSLQEARTRGFRNCNIKLGGAPEWDLRLCKMVNDFFPDGFLWGDANGGLPTYEAVSRALALAEAGLKLLEQPVAPDRPDLSAQITARSPIPIALDEPITGPVSLLDLIQRRSLSCLALKVTRNGGFRPSIQCAQLAEAAGLMLVSSGLTDAGIAFAANVQLAAMFGIKYPCALNGPQFLPDDILATSLPREADLVRIPDRPGLGVEVDEDKVRQYASRTGGTHHRIA